METVDKFSFTQGHRVIIRKIGGRLHLEVKEYDTKLLLCVPYPYYNFVVDGEEFKIIKG